MREVEDRGPHGGQFERTRQAPRRLHEYPQPMNRVRVLVEQAGVVHRECRSAPQFPRQRQILSPVAPAGLGSGECDGTELPISRDQRHDHRRPQAEFA